MEGTLGEVRMFGGNFSPENWAFCSGQILTVADYPALYSLIGDTYNGGDGQSSFALPDLRARSCIQFGYSGYEDANYKIGDEGGNETIALNASNLPAHKHFITQNDISFYSVQEVYQGSGDSITPNNAYPAVVDDNVYFASPGQYEYASSQAEVTVTNNMETSETGEGEAFYIRTPYTVVNYIICIKGDFPSRN